MIRNDKGKGKKHTMKVRPEKEMREELKEKLKECSKEERYTFTQAYSPHVDRDVDLIVDIMSIDKLEWAIQQTINTIEKNKELNNGTV